MSEIKAGDKVRFVSEDFGDITNGTTGVVTRVWGVGETAWAYVHFGENRFEDSFSCALSSLELVEVASQQDGGAGAGVETTSDGAFFDKVRAEAETTYLNGGFRAIVGKIADQQAELDKLRADIAALTTRNRALLDAVAFAVDALDGLAPLDALIRLYALKRKVDALK